MLFIQTKDGISHTPDEYTSNEDIERGFKATMTGLAALIASDAKVMSGEVAHV